MPDNFVGLWAQRISGCADPEGVPTMWIDRPTVRFYEARDSVAAVRLHGPGDLTVKFRDWSDSEGRGVREATARMVLSPRGDSMTLSMEGDEVTYLRCPVVEPRR